MDRLLSPRTKRVALVVGVVALVALAGCTSGGSDDTTTPTTNGTDMGQLASDHAAQIDAAQSLTTSQEIVVQQAQNDTTVTDTRQRITYFDLENSLGLENYTRTYSSAQGEVVQSADTYTVNDETYLRSYDSRIGQTRYFYGQEPYNQSEPPSPLNFTSAGDVSFYEFMNASVEAQGTTEFQGESVQRYTANGTENLPNVTDLYSSSFGTIDGANATLLVTDDGLVRHMEIQLTGTSTGGQPLAVTIRLTASDIDSTTVQEPDWLSEVGQSS